MWHRRRGGPGLARCAQGADLPAWISALASQPPNNHSGRHGSGQPNGTAADQTDGSRTVRSGPGPWPSLRPAQASRSIPGRAARRGVDPKGAAFCAAESTRSHSPGNSTETRSGFGSDGHP